ncbi:B12-binding domain-containing radical SAM protein, partial [Dehalococcoides mccartyi]
KHGIMPRLYIMLAVPTETVEDFTETQDMLHRMEDPPFMYMRFVPYPGTPFTTSWYRTTG